VIALSHSRTLGQLLVLQSSVFCSCIYIYNLVIAMVENMWNMF